MVLGFSLVLRPYSDEVIIAAFRYWMETQSVLPTPADIKEICYSKIKMHPLKPQEQPVIKQQANEMPAEEFEQWLAEQKNKLKTSDSDEAKKARLDKMTRNDYTHYNRMSDEQKEQFANDFKDCVERLRRGETVFGRGVGE